MNDLLLRVAESIRRHELARRGESLLVGVSGGLDSTVLLAVLHGLASGEKWRLVVAHFNHRLRGEESDADEQFVRELSARLGLPLVTGQGDVRAFAQARGVSVEMAARELRHAFFARAARRRRIRVLALGHHADDQVELFFLRLFRGAGGEGLGGMSWSGPAPFDPRLRVIRPLLDLRKQELEAWAGSEGVAFRQDASNESLDHLRNRVRHKVLPLVSRQFGRETPGTILRAMSILRAESECVETAARTWLTSRREIRFDQLPVAVQRQCILLQLRDMGISPRFDVIESLRQQPGQALTIAPGQVVTRSGNGEVRREPLAPAQFDGSETVVELGKAPGRTRFAGVTFTWKVERTRSGAAGGRTPQTAGEECFDAGRVGETIRLRHWRTGDRYQPIGLPHDIKLQDAFVNQKIPRSRRHQLVVATTLDGRIFWVEGLRISEQFKLDKPAASRLKWRWFRQAADSP